MRTSYLAALYNDSASKLTELRLTERERNELQQLVAEDRGTAYVDADGELVSYVLADAGAPRGAALVELPSLDYAFELLGQIAADTEFECTNVVQGIELLKQELCSIEDELNVIEEEL